MEKKKKKKKKNEMYADDIAIFADTIGGLQVKLKLWCLRTEVQSAEMKNDIFQIRRL